MWLKIKIVFIGLIVICNFSFKNQEDNRKTKMVRLGFYEATQDSKKAKPLSIIIKSFKSKSSIIKAYEGANMAILAKTKWNPFSAIRLVKKSRGMLDFAVHQTPKNLEIRFIRFAVQKNIPSFLNLSENIDEDKNFIIKNINRFNSKVLSKNIRNYILNFMMEQGGYNEEEKKLIKEKLS